MNSTLPPDFSSRLTNPELNGFKIGPYRVLELIGRGGMAIVYKAYQPSTDRLVALKVLLDYFNQNSIAVQRFQQEARVIARLEHPNIVQVYDSGQDGDIIYLVMRYMRAGTVQDVIARGPLSLRDASSLVTEIAAALDYAHSLNIIHRDVKPNNILVDIHGHAHLSDFGLAKVLGGAVELTKTSTSMGTPAYMAPEQTMGLPVTSQTDIYGLGVILYEMLTGERPFSAETPMAEAMMHIQGTLRLPRHINTTISEAAEAVILRAMAKDPANRYRTATEMAKALAEALESESKSQPPTPSYLKAAAAEIAMTKGPEEVTLDIRSEMIRQDRALRRKKLLAMVPWIAVTFLLIGLAASIMFAINLNQKSASAAGQTATAVTLLLNQLNSIQTAVAEGQSGLEPTLQYLQTRLAAEPVTGTAVATTTPDSSGTTSATSTSRNSGPSATPPVPTTTAVASKTTAPPVDTPLPLPLPTEVPELLPTLPIQLP